MPELSTSIVFADLPLGTLPEDFDGLQTLEHLLFISPAKACWISKAAEHFGLRFKIGQIIQRCESTRLHSFISRVCFGPLGVLRVLRLVDTPVYTLTSFFHGA